VTAGAGGRVEGGRATVSARTGPRAWPLILVVLASGLASVVAGAAEPITRRAAVPPLASLKQYHEIPDFRIGGRYDLDRPEAWQRGGEGGVTLESLGAGPLRVAYIAVGTPRRNAAGEITNAVVVSSYYSGDATNMYSFWYEGQPGNGFAGGPVIGPGRLLDTDRYFVILLDALGLWGASKPSDGLGMKFPRYTMWDLVQANYRLLRDHLKVAQVELATGVSMGGSQAYLWALLHPGYVKAIMPIGGTPGADSLARWVFQLMTAALESDPVWRETGGAYYHLPKDRHPNQGVMFGWSILTHTGLDLKFRSTQPWSAVVKDVFYWEPKGEAAATLRQRARDFDAVDLWYRNQATTAEDVSDLLPRIKARTLVVHVENDQWLVVDQARRAAAAIPGALFTSFRHDLAHYAVFRAPNERRDVIAAFLADCAFIGAGSVLAGAGNGRPAGLSK
jgi:homoserine O-acetyltransferase